MAKGNIKPKADENYIEMREGLVPDAEKIANKICGATRGKRTSDDYAEAWNKVFHDTMERLVQEFYNRCNADWIVGTEECRLYIHAGSWRSARRWIKRYKAPIRYWIDARPVFIKREIDEWLAKTGRRFQEEREKEARFGMVVKPKRGRPPKIGMTIK